MPCSTPVTFIIFKRPDVTARAWEAIRATRPDRLFIIADGARNADEASKCAETRRVVEQVDWPCEVQRNYSEPNMGCRNRIASGLDWVFSQVPEAIVLEDDCVPAPSFFGFCTELLERYRTTERVMHICGSNYLGRRDGPYSYHFSRYPHLSGWAGWARAWRRIDLHLKRWREFKRRRASEIFKDTIERKHWIRKFRPIASGERTDSWGYPWWYSVWMEDGLAIVPTENRVTNIGFGPEATHTREDSPLANVPANEISSALIHPPDLRVDEAADGEMFDKILGGARLKLRRSWQYRLSKVARVYQKITARAQARR